ncbi:MAG: Calx-beta domain-containing protein [Woeseiaceae bacterium]
MQHKLTPIPGVAPRAPVRAGFRSPGSSIGLAFLLLAAAPLAHAQVVVSVEATDATAGESPADSGEFLISRESGNPLQTVIVNYEVTGTATEGADYAALSGSVTLSLFVSEEEVPITVTGSDGLFEGDESVTIRLVPSSNYEIATDSATVNIADTPHSVTVSAGANATEDPVAAGELLVSLGARNESGATVAVDYTVDGTATPGTDYAALGGVALISPGATTASVNVTPVSDELVEGDETVEITLTETNDSRVPVGDPDTASVSIADDEAVADDDGDGLINIIECPDVSQCRDTDQDSTPDYQDPDDDNDTVPTADENAPDQDTDSDSIPDYQDDNDDGDSRLTRDEDANEDGDGNPATDPTDIDDDGLADYLDPDDQGGPTGDPDGDGLTNEREEEIGTDPQVADTDSDGVNDGDEDAAGTDPLDPRAFADADGDLVPDPVETTDGTDPNNPASFQDSDSGGTADHVETVTYATFGATATDPLDPLDDRRDFDGDGLPDRLEISIGGAPDSADSPTQGGAGDDSGNGVSNAVDAYLATLGIASADATSDFDRDGYPDVAEIGLALSPSSSAASDSDGDGVPNVIELLAGVDIDATTDSDADGVPDAREIALNADPLDANSPVANGAADDDGDGAGNAIENVLQAFGIDDADNSSDSDADGLTDADEIRFGADPLHDEQPVPWIELSQAAFGPVRALSPDGGVATASAMIGGHQSGLSYDWSGTSNAVLAVVSGGQTNKTLAFSPATLPPGIYQLAVSVQRTSGSVITSASVVDFTLSVIAGAGAAELADADNDGVPDSSDVSDARNGFANRLPAQSATFIEATAGVRLQLGSTALTQQATSARVTLEDIAAAGDGDGGSVGNSEDEFEYMSGIYDFEVTNLPEIGAVVQIVIPQATAIGEFPEYRRFLPASGWGNFAEDANNTVASAAGTMGACPPPGDESFTPGLTPGHSCVQLSIEDGGPNDGDAEDGPNGVIKDPSGVATPLGRVVAGQGSGAMGPAVLFVLGLFAARAVYRRRRRAVGVTLTTLGCLCLVAAPPAARADAFVGGGVGLSSLSPETAGTPFTVADDQDSGFKVFGGVDLTPISPNLSVELLWADLGQATLSGNGKVDYGIFGAGLKYGIGNVTAPRFSGFIEGGFARFNIDANVPFQQEDDTSLFVGIAGSFAIRRQLFLQLEYQYFAEDAQLITLSLVKRFRIRSSSQVETIPLPER